MGRDKVQYEVGFKISAAPASREIVLAILSANGFDLSGAVDIEDKGGRSISFYVVRRALANRMATRLRGLKIKGARVFFRTHREKEWSARWKKDWHPFALTRRFHVIPLWQKDRSLPKGKEPIYLETTNAFGTGLHETTRFTSELIEGRAGSIGSFLDIGTGTGILAIVALKCGASQVCAFDIDASAVRVAKDNLKANGLSCMVRTADVKDLRLPRSFDLVAANLVSPDLIEFRERIGAFVKPDGYLIVSGISLKNVPRVKKAFTDGPFRLLKVIKGREWAAFLLRSKVGSYV